SALRKLLLHGWPGNVRELRNVVHRAIVLSAGPQILPGDVILSGDTAPDELTPTFRQLRAKAIEDFERFYVERLLREHNGNVKRAAREAGKDRRTFGRLIRKYAIDRHRFAEPNRPWTLRE